MERISLLSMSGRELDRLFRCSPAGAPPRGTADGVFLLMPGTPAARPLARLLRLAWRGKAFDDRRAAMANLVLPIGLRAVRARVRPGVSRLDGGACHVLDYSRTSLVARHVRDEIREIAPGIYLGLVHWRGLRIGRFALRFPPGRVAAAGC